MLKTGSFVTKLPNRFARAAECIEVCGWQMHIRGCDSFASCVFVAFYGCWFRFIFVCMSECMSELFHVLEPVSGVASLLHSTCNCYSQVELGNSARERTPRQPPRLVMLFAHAHAQAYTRIHRDGMCHQIS